MSMTAHAAALLLGAFALTATSSGASGLFDVDGSMESNGWRLVRSAPDDVFSVSGGVLSMRCSCNPYKGTLYSRPVELPARGEMTFELMVGVGAGPSYRSAVLLKLGDLLLSVSGDSLMRYRVSAKPAWKSVGEHRVPRATWVPAKVAWDNDAGRMVYYVGDMRIPSAAEDGRIGVEPGEPAMTLKIGNYGLDHSVFTHSIRGLSVCAASGVEAAPAERSVAVVFHGLGSEFFPVDKWLAGFDAKDRFDFFLSFRGSQYLPVNNMMLDGYPDESLLRRAKLIVLADMPLSADVLSYEAQENILGAVADGARLVATGGLVGLEKCGDLDSPIARLLPGLSGSPWRADAREKAVRRHGKGMIAVVRRATGAR